MDHAEIRPGRLVVTPDSYFGIITSVTDRTVYCGNGLDVILAEEDWRRLHLLPMRIGETGTFADFVGIERYLVGRNP